MFTSHRLVDINRHTNNIKAYLCATNCEQIHTSRLVFPTVSFSGGTFLLAQPGVMVTHGEIPTILQTLDLWHLGEMRKDQLHVGAQDSQRDCRNRNTRAVTKSLGS